MLIIYLLFNNNILSLQWNKMKIYYPVKVKLKAKETHGTQHKISLFNIFNIYSLSDFLDISVLVELRYLQNVG